MENKLKNAQISMKRKQGEIDDLNKIIQTISKKPAFTQPKSADSKPDQVFISSY